MKDENGQEGKKGQNHVDNVENEKDDGKDGKDCFSSEDAKLNLELDFALSFDSWILSFEIDRKSVGKKVSIKKTVSTATDNDVKLIDLSIVKRPM